MSAWERLGIAIAGPVIAASIIGVAVLLRDIGQSLEVMLYRMDRVESQISGVYTDSEAERELAPIRERLTDHELRIDALEHGE